MRQGRLLVVIVLAAAACKQQPPGSSPPPAASPPVETASLSAPAAATDGIRGKIAEKIDASQYSYLRLQTAAGETWAAVPKTDKAVGAEVTVVNVAWMENFKSNSMNRSWERIAFGTLGDASAATASPAAAPPAMPAGHPPTGGSQGMFAGAAASDSAAAPNRQHPAPSPAADVGHIRVAKAAGPQGRTVAEVWASRAALKDKKVSVRGKVVKATNGVLGKNWLHVRDGTGSGNTADLAIASDDTAAVGETVLVTGVVHVDKDLGAGYHYDVIVEDAKIKAE